VAAKAPGAGGQPRDNWVHEEHFPERKKARTRQQRTGLIQKGCEKLANLRKMPPQVQGRKTQRNWDASALEG